MYREKIDGKIEKVVDYIIEKPESKITLDDYTILRDVRAMESDKDTRERMERLVSAVGAGFSHA